MNKRPHTSGTNRDNKTRIAISGATSHIAKGLIHHFTSAGEVRLFLFARDVKPLHRFLKDIGALESGDLTIYQGYQEFLEYSYDVIINCVGLGTVSEEPHVYTSFFMVTEEFDNLIMSYLIKSPRTCYINFSSGAVYGNNYLEPSNRDSLNKIRVNRISRDDYFTIAKLNSEAKHRAFENLNIIDIRVFSYFSRFIDLEGKYFMTELLNALVHKKVFYTNSQDMVRDYIHPEDLLALINKCIGSKAMNTSFDAYSLQPVRKTEILEFFASEYNLKYRIRESSTHHTVTGQKTIYYSLYQKAGELGYQPCLTSLETISQEAPYILWKESKQDRIHTKLQKPDRR
jgi:nucleoside-diphosphate-sugar epimerase